MQDFLLKLVSCHHFNSCLGGGLDDSDDEDDKSERDILGHIDKNREAKESEDLHRAVARTISLVMVAQRARNSPEDQVLLTCARKAEDTMKRSLSAIEDRVPGLLPIKCIRKRPAKRLGLKICQSDHLSPQPVCQSLNPEPLPQ